MLGAFAFSLTHPEFVEIITKYATNFCFGVPTAARWVDDYQGWMSPFHL